MNALRATSRKTSLQAAAIGVVLVAGVVTSTTGTAGAATQHRAAAAPTVAASPQPSSAPTPPAAHDPASRRAPKSLGNPKPTLKLSHPKHEAWSRLLAKAPAGWTTTFAPKNLTAAAVSRGSAAPSATARALRFDGFRRGVIRTVRGAHYGVVEQLWQFRRHTGAQAVFIASVALTHAQTQSHSAHSTFIGQHGDFGVVFPTLDSTGYHYGIGVALEGDMLVQVRVFGIAPVTRHEVRTQLHRAERPVARGISRPGLVGIAGAGSLPGASSVST